MCFVGNMVTPSTTQTGDLHPLHLGRNLRPEGYLSSRAWTRGGERREGEGGREDRREEKERTTSS